MFNASTVAQMAAFFAVAESAASAKINILKLMKLMYLADREFMRCYGGPISYDNMVSMPHGPVLSRTLNLINGFVEGAHAKIWDAWISNRANHMVAARRKFTSSELDHISPAELEVLEAVWKKFGGMNQWELCDYTHKHCKEWKDPSNAMAQSTPITEMDMLLAVGFKEADARDCAEEIESAKSMEQHFVAR